MAVVTLSTNENVVWLGGKKTIGTKGCSKQQCSYLFKGNDPNETSNTGDVGVVKAQQGEDGVRLEGRQQQSWETF